MARPAPVRPVRFRIAVAGLCLAGAVGCGGGGGGTIGVPPPSAPPTPGGTTVGPAGGTVTGLNGAATLVIPANALSSNVSLTLTAATGVPLDPSAVTGSWVQLAPPATFAVPATLTLRYDPALRPSGSDESELRVHVQAGPAWQPVGSGSADVAAHTATAAIGAAGVFAVRWPDPTSPCTGAESRQFDFWLGSWNFTATGSAAGTNDITMEAAGCLVQEHFLDANRAQGRSVSFVSRLDGLWHQTYIDTGGLRQELVGRFEDGQMRLYQSATQRFSWLPQGPDRIRYYEERTSDGGATWAVRFDSAYTRR